MIEVHPGSSLNSIQIQQIYIYKNMIEKQNTFTNEAKFFITYFSSFGFY